MFKKFLGGILKHKIISAIVIIALAGGGYYAYKSLNSKGTETKYVLAAVQKGTITTSVSGTGQVSASNQVDVQAKASGELVYLNVKQGQAVKAGALLAQIDAGDAYKSVRDAQANLDSAKLSLEKLNQPTDDLSILQAENALTQAQESKQKAEDDLKKAYDDGFNNVADTFLDLPSIMTGLQDIIFSTNFKAGQQNIDYYTDVAKAYDEKALKYNTDTLDKYETARDDYGQNYDDYKASSRFSSTETIEALISQSYDTVKNIAEAIKSTTALIQFYQDELTEHSLNPQSLSNTHLSNLNSYTSKTNAQLLNLLSIKRTIQTDKETIVNADRTITEKTESLADLKAGADPLDVKSQELSIKQKQNALQDAYEKLADYSVRAPFDGIIAATDVAKGDTVSNGTTVATLITKQKIAEISLNEVDAAQVKVGQKTILTFDAVSDLTITGEVAEIDTLGTVSQGVVSYDAKITFDTQDERIKSGMSVSASIITNVKTDVLMAPNAAVKSQNDADYVEMPTDQNLQTPTAANSTGITLSQPTKRQIVTIGIANDTYTEIVSGLNEGDLIIKSTTTNGYSTSTNSSSKNNSRVGGEMMMLGGGAPR